jgi:hypothetical protein
VILRTERPRKCGLLFYLPNPGRVRSRNDMRAYSSGRAIELAFLDHPLMQFGGAFNLVLKVVAFGRQKSRYLIDACRSTDAERP